MMPRSLVEPCVLAGCPEHGLVLDLFAGACTVGVVAIANGRHFKGNDINAEYVEMGRSRLMGVAPLLHCEVAA